jgi:KDO2-lipid IV(A) lauroyltransferase
MSRMGSSGNDGDSGRPAVPKPRSSLPRIEFGKSKQGDIVYYASLITASLLSWLVALLPDRLVDKLAWVGGWISWRFAHESRRNVTTNMTHVLGLPATDQQISVAVRNVFHTNALNIVDLLRIPHLAPRDYGRRIQTEPATWEVLDVCQRAGKGVILITAHLGPFDLAGSALRLRGYELSALTARTTNRFVFHGISFLRSSHDMRVIETSAGGLLEMLRALNRGQMVILLSDRDFFLSGRQTQFFGESTTLPIGAVRLARDTGTPIVPFFAYRRGNQAHLVSEDPIEIERTTDRDADIERGLAVVAAVLERAIARAPDQWALFQRVWPEPFEPDAARKLP